jgi:hypothetical protein
MAGVSAIPARIQPGYVCIYGAASVNGFDYDQRTYAFGKVAQLPDELPHFVYNGQSCFFKMEDGIRVKYGSTDYYLLPEPKIIFVEITPP